MHSPSYNKSQMFLVHVFCLEKKRNILSLSICSILCMWRVFCVGRLRCPNILVREGLTVQATVWPTPAKYWPHVACYVLYFKDRLPGGLLRQSIRIPLIANQSSWPFLFHFSHNWFYFYLTCWNLYFAQLVVYFY